MHEAAPRPRPTAAARALPVALAGLAVLGVLVALGSRPPAPKPAAAPELEFSAARALSILQRLLAEGVPHPVGTPANFLVRDRIGAELEALGLAVQVQRTWSCRPRGVVCAPVENLMARLPGTGAGRAVMLTSHYDSRGAGPGAGDAGSGVAAVLEIARILRAEGPQLNPVVLLFTDGEEAGLLGAEAFVREHPWAADVAAVVNLEARGTSGPSIMFETSEGNRWIVAAFARTARRPVASSLTYEVYRLLPNDTDATVYRRAGMAVLNFAFIDGLVHYHTALDDLAHLSPRSVQHHGDNALAAVRALAAVPLEPPLETPGGDAAYLDVFGRVLLLWPAGWVLPLALLFTAVLLGAAVLLVRRGESSGAELLFGLLAAVAALAAALGVGWATGTLITAGTGRPGVAHAYPLPAYAALWAGAATAVLAVATLLARRAAQYGLLLGVWLLLSLLTLLLAVRLPGAAVVLLVPQFVATLAVGFAVFGSPTRRLSPDGATLFACLGAGFTLIHLALMLQATFVLQLPLAIACVVALAALPLMPLAAVAGSDRRPRSIILAGGAVITLAALALALVVPGYSATRPQHLNIIYLQSPDDGEQWWIAQGVAAADALPPAVRSAGGGFSSPPPGWAPRLARGPAAPAPAADVALPRVEVLSRRGDRLHRRIALRVHGAEPGNRVVLALPAAGSVRVEGRAVAGMRGAGGAQALWLVHVPAEGVHLQIDLPGGTEQDVAIYDLTPGLPAAGARLLQARPSTATPFADGDATVVLLRLRL
jgi:hypothetical protein